MVNLLPRGRVATLFPLLGMLVALLLPLYGPWLDPLFMDHMPFHSHIYLGEVNIHHHHSEEPHYHVDTTHNSEHDCTTVFSGVVNVPGEIVTRPLILVWEPGSLVDNVPDHNGLMFTWQADRWLVDTVFLVPPHRPPRP